MKYLVDGITVHSYYNELIIWNSYNIEFKNIKSFVDRLMCLDPTSNVLKQSPSILCAELFVHNLLYKLNIKRDHTKDTNLSVWKDFKWYEKIVYSIIRIFF